MAARVGTVAWSTQRQRTAITRAGLSVPVRQALVDGLLHDGDVLDYGSGRGQDVRRLTAVGINARGWDPYFSPDGVREPADTVVLSYVLNVIESPKDRQDALAEAWRLARRTLVVATRLSWEARRIAGDVVGDGVVTSKSTFQHLFEPGEFRDFVHTSTDGLCLFPAPGMAYIFRTEADRMRCLARRTVTDFEWQVADGYAQALSNVVRFLEERGRPPLYEELPSHHLPLLARVSPSSLRRAAEAAADPARVASGSRRTVLDTLLFLGTAIFDGRPRLAALPVQTQADIRTFFGSYREACRRADRLLLKLRDDTYLRAVMYNAVGKLTPTALYVHRSAVPAMPILLRLYEHCGAVAAGRPNDWDVLKLHHGRRAVSWLGYPTFDEDPHPKLESSYFVDMATLRTEWKDYSQSSNRPILHRKHEFVTHEHPRREQYERLTRSELRAGLYEHPELIGTSTGWERQLALAGVRLRGHRLVRNPPDDINR